MKSSIDIVKATLNILGVVGAGQHISAEDAANIRSILSAVIDDLDNRNICHLRSNLDADEFDDQYLLTIPRIVAYHAAPSYGFGAERTEFLSDMQRAETTILSTHNTTRGDQPVETFYF